MRFTIVTVMMVAILAGCDAPVEQKPAPKEPEFSEAESRYRILKGEDVSQKDIQRVGEIFGSKITDLSLWEAKECRVTLYTQSAHFNSGNPTGFTGDFAQQDRDKSDANRMTFAYAAFDYAVKHREKEKAVSEMEDAPQSVQKQILRQGEFYTSVLSLARCKPDEMIRGDSNTPYFQVYCVGAGKTKRREQNTTRALMADYCNTLASEFLETGGVKPSVLTNSPMR